MVNTVYFVDFIALFQIMLMINGLVNEVFNYMIVYCVTYLHSSKVLLSHSLFTQETNVWEAQVTCGGHFASVEDIAWQPKAGNFLMSTSLDQTTRCHGYWKSHNPQQVSERLTHKIAM